MKLLHSLQFYYSFYCFSFFISSFNFVIRFSLAKGASSCPQQQLGDLREQYARLQEDYRNKLTEVSVLRADAEKMKQETREAKEEREKAENRLLDVQERLRSMESDKLKFHGQFCCIFYFLRCYDLNMIFKKYVR